MGFLNPRTRVMLALCLLPAPAVPAGTANRDFSAELKDIYSPECPVQVVCTRGLSDLESHFSIYDRADWSGLGPEQFQLHYNRYPVFGSSGFLNLLIRDVKSGALFFEGKTGPAKGERKLDSYPQGYRETIRSGDMQGESRTLFVGLDTAIVWFRYRNLGSAARTIRPILVGRFGDLPPPPTHSKPGGSKPGPNPLPPFPPGKLGPGTNVSFDQGASVLIATRYMDLPRADAGRVMFALKLPPYWKARLSNDLDPERILGAQGEGASEAAPYLPGPPAMYGLVGPDQVLAAHQEYGFAVVIAFGLLHHFGINYIDELTARARNHETERLLPEKAWKDGKTRWNRFFASLPAPYFRIPQGDRLYLSSFYTLKRNLYAPDWDFHYRALFETKGWYDAVWQWSVAPFGQLALMQLDPALAREQTYFFTENALPTGMIPEHVFNTFVPTDTIHPQLLTYGAWLVYLQTHDKAYLERIYGPLARHFDWLCAGGMDTAGNVRDKDRDGLFEWGTQAWDDGLDNAVRSDVGLEKFEAVDLNAYVLLSEKCLVRMAEELQMPAEAARWRARAEALAKVMMARLYDPDSNLFWDCYYDTHRPFKVLGFNNFLPLLAGVPLPDEKRKQMVRDYLLNPQHFWGILPFPTLAFSDSHYSPTNYMRGPVWPGPSFLLIATLWKNGFHAEADVAARRFLETVGKYNGIYENYNSKTGEPLYGKRVEMISWNAACVIDLFLGLYHVDDGLSSGAAVLEGNVPVRKMAFDRGASRLGRPASAGGGGDGFGDGSEDVVRRRF